MSILLIGPLAARRRKPSPLCGGDLRPPVGLCQLSYYEPVRRTPHIAHGGMRGSRGCVPVFGLAAQIASYAIPSHHRLVGN